MSKWYQVDALGADGNKVLIRTEEVAVISIEGHMAFFKMRSGELHHRDLRTFDPADKALGRAFLDLVAAFDLQDRRG